MHGPRLPPALPTAPTLSQAKSSCQRGLLLPANSHPQPSKHCTHPAPSRPAPPRAPAPPQPAAAGEEQDGDYASVGGTTVGSIRAWLRHSREFLYQTLGLLPSHCPAALGCAPVAAVFPPAVFSYVEVRRAAQLPVL